MKENLGVKEKVAHKVEDWKHLASSIWHLAWGQLGGACVVATRRSRLEQEVG